MKYRRATIVADNWHGEFGSYDEWARLGPQPPYRAATFFDAQGRRCITQHDFARARDDRAFPLRYRWERTEARKRREAQVGSPPFALKKSLPVSALVFERLSALVLNDHAYDKLTGWSNVIPVVPVKGDATETYKFINEESHGTRSTPHRHRS